MTNDVMPAAFLGHGSPLNALDHNKYTEAWAAFGAACPQPRAIVVVSAHWFVNVTAVTAMARPKTIHDFYGFPEELFAVRYDAPGDPDLAGELCDIVKPTWVGLDHDSWGLDHGTWSVLVHAFPDATIPVLQLSLHADMPLQYHVDLGAQLSALRQKGVVLIGSGNIVHNLRRLDRRLTDEGTTWARSFNDASHDLLMTSPSDVVALRDHADYDAAVPTADHFLPLLYFAGLAQVGGETPQRLVDGYAYGSLSMDSYTLGAECPRSDNAANRSAQIPSDVSPENANV